MCRVIFLFCLRCGVGHLALKFTGLGLSVERPLGELLPINGSWGQEISGGSKSWSWVSHLRGSGLTPYWNSKTSQATKRRRPSPRLLLKATLSSPEHPVRLTPKSSNISRKVSGPVVGSMWSAQSQMWPYFNLYLLLKFTVSPKFHCLFPA